MYRLLFVFLGYFLLAKSISAHHIDMPKVYSESRRGTALAMSGNYSGGLKKLKELLSIETDSRIIKNTKGDIEIIEAALSGKITKKAAHHLLSGIFTKNDEDYLTELNKAATESPSFLRTYLDMSGVYSIRGQYKKALDAIDMALFKDPVYTDAIYTKGHIYSQLADYEIAIQLYSKVLSIDNEYYAALNNRGRLYLETNKPAKAIADLKKAISLNPNISDAYINTALYYYNKKMESKACEYSQDACTLGSCEILIKLKQNGLCNKQ